MAGKRLPREFYARDTRVVARALLGKLLVHRDRGVLRAARIVETEAYHGPDDRASHARFGATDRTAVMFGAPGTAYVYLIYGRSHCMNVVTGPEGFPAAVLVRAAEPVEGCLHSTRGPGNLCRALGILRQQDDGRDLTGDRLYLLDAPRPGRVVTGPRVNVAYAGAHAARRWRFAVAGSRWVSRPAPEGVSPSRRPTARARRAPAALTAQAPRGRPRRGRPGGSAP